MSASAHNVWSKWNNAFEARAYEESKISDSMDTDRKRAEKWRDMFTQKWSGMLKSITDEQKLLGLEGQLGADGLLVPLLFDAIIRLRAAGWEESEIIGMLKPRITEARSVADLSAELKPKRRSA